MSPAQSPYPTNDFTQDELRLLLVIADSWLDGIDEAKECVIKDHSLMSVDQLLLAASGMEEQRRDINRIRTKLQGMICARTA